jgi:hypothetical protein
VEEGSGDNKRTKIVKHEDKSEWIRTNIQVQGWEYRENRDLLNPGSYQYPFSYLIPENLPTSFLKTFNTVRTSDSIASLEYTLTAHTVIPDQLTHIKKKSSVQIYQPPSKDVLDRERKNYTDTSLLDRSFLEKDTPSAKSKTQTWTLRENICRCFRASGSLSASLNFGKEVYNPGERCNCL